MFKVDISNDKAELYEKIVSVKLLVIVIIYFKRYPSTYCLMQGRCFILATYKNIYFKIRVTSFKDFFKVEIQEVEWWGEMFDIIGCQKSFRFNKKHHVLKYTLNYQVSCWVIYKICEFGWKNRKSLYIVHKS